MTSKPSLKERQRQARRELILDVAERLFRDRGYGVVPLEEIAAEANISKPTLYSHFRSKEDLAVGITLRALDEVNRFLDGQDASLTSFEKLMSFMEWAVAFRFGPQARLGKELVAIVMPAQNEEMVREDTRFFEKLTSLIAGAQLERKVRSDVPPHFLTAILLGSQHGYLDDLLAEERVSLAQIIEMWLKLLQP